MIIRAAEGGVSWIVGPQIAVVAAIGAAGDDASRIPCPAGGGVGGDGVLQAASMGSRAHRWRWRCR
jgi:hypothetical protein